MSKYDDCIETIKAASGNTLTKEQAEELLQSIHEKAEQKKAIGMLTQEALLADVNEIAINLVEDAYVQKRNQLINKVVASKFAQHISNFDNSYEGVSSYLVGSHKAKEGALLSIDAKIKATVDGNIGKLISTLKSEGVLQVFTSGEFDDDIAREMWELPNGNPGVTGKSEALRVARIINSMQNELVHNQNKVGAMIKLSPSYIVRQTHNMLKVSAAGFEKWASDILPLLDPIKTFGDKDPMSVLKGAYDGISTGRHMVSKGDLETRANVFEWKGFGNLAKKVSSERSLHFKSADSWMTYNRIYGNMSIREAVVAGLESASKNYVLMQSLGTNPRHMFESVLETLGNKLSPEDVYKLKKEFDQIDGTAKIPVNVSMAHYSAVARMVQNMALLGSAVISSITDIPTQAAALRLNGVGLFDSYKAGIHNLLKGRGDAERQELAQLLGVGIEAMIGDITSRFSANDGVAGTTAKLQQKFFNLNLMNWWNDVHNTGIAHILSANLANNISLPFDSLPGHLGTILRQYGITKEDWAIARLAVESDKQSPNKFFNLQKIASIEDSQIIDVYGLDKTSQTPETRRKIRDIRDELELKYRTYLNDQIHHAIPLPGAAEHSTWILGGGTSRGTVLGEVIRFIGQFKSFPITVARKALGPQMYINGADSVTEAMFKGKANYSGLAALLVATTTFGYIAAVIKDTIRGISPPDPTKPETIVRAMTQGGGLGIYGDFIFGEFNKYGQSPVATLSGPVFGQFENILKLYSRAKAGESVGGQLSKLIQNNTPFANLFYTRAAFDYMFLYQLQESLNPGYLSRLEQRIMTERGQEFYVPPSQAIPYGGGNRILEGVRE